MSPFTKTDLEVILRALKSQEARVKAQIRMTMQDGLNQEDLDDLSMAIYVATKVELILRDL